MSEQRFKSNCSKTWKSILEYKENGELEEYSLEDDEQIEELVGVLNEQQDKISRLEEENEQLKQDREENEQLKEQLQMIKEIIQTQITETEEYLQTSIRGGMPTGSLYSEIELLQKLKKECLNE